MAQKTVVHLEDDIDGSEALETVIFGLDGTTYEIDHNEKNASALREALAPYLSTARRSTAFAGGGGGRARNSSPSKPRASGGDIDPKAVRTWAEANGIEVSPRGRIKAEILEKYRAAN